MKGTSHAVVGAATGFIVANYVQANPTDTLLLVGFGGISGLMPDMDIDGKLSNKITLSHKVFQTIAQVIGLMMIMYSFYKGSVNEMIYGIGLGGMIIFISYRLKQRHMLTVTGIGVLLGGISLDEKWLMLLGVYIIISSFISHRTYTHSILGIIFYGFIAFQFEQSIKIEGVYYTCLLAYISHLFCDFRFLPFNKRGVKLFLPISSKEI
ncbi:metal-dependent hydrolase [Niallia sp. 01092]|uniref:metal-dependent hydrolase n=1 Tax=unclassified Niallia TaxID=2837522 RepID=UPI003FCF0E79